MKEFSKHDWKLFTRYASELLLVFGLYALALVVAHRFGWPLQAGTGKALLMLCPIVPFLLMILVLVRSFQRADEYWRQRMLQDWAIAAVITAALTFSYGFLENLGFPRLSMFDVLPAMFALYALVNVSRLVARR
jgi:hypothetical protein